MEVIYWLGCSIIILFGFVVWFGAPYLPTMRAQADQALDLLDLHSGQTLLELGCGDGRVVRAAAARGLRVVGYELNPLLVIIAKVVTLRYRKQVRIVWGSYWHGQLPPADGIFVFLLDKYMVRLNKKIIQDFRGHKVKLVSYAFKIPRKKPVKTAGPMFLYVYDA